MVLFALWQSNNAQRGSFIRCQLINIYWWRKRCLSLFTELYELHFNFSRLWEYCDSNIVILLRAPLLFSENFYN